MLFSQKNPAYIFYSDADQTGRLGKLCPQAGSHADTPGPGLWSSPVPAQQAAQVCVQSAFEHLPAGRCSGKPLLLWSFLPVQSSSSKFLVSRGTFLFQSPDGHDCEQVAPAAPALSGGSPGAPSTLSHPGILWPLWGSSSQASWLSSAPSSFVAASSHLPAH